jgi:phosphoglycolate phosphatase-like HAD superfamily hydrolase
MEQLREPLTPERMTIVGDTPRDITCARHYGARVLAVASGYHSTDQLRAFQPDALLPDLSNTGEVMQVLAAI